MPERRPKPWTRAEIAQLGEVPDSVLARRTGRTIQEVVAERERRRPGLPTRPRRWTAREIKMLDRLLGTAKDEEIARHLKRPLHGVRARRRTLGIHSPAFKASVRRWTAAKDALLGTMNDRKFARKFSHALSAVKKRRIQLGIPVFNSARHA